APAEILSAPTLSPLSQTQAEPVESFSQWRQALREEALGSGIEAALFDRLLGSISPDPGVLKSDSSQPEFTRPVWEYLDGAVSASRIGRGRVLLAQHN